MVLHCILAIDLSAYIIAMVTSSSSLLKNVLFSKVIWFWWLTSGIIPWHHSAPCLSKSCCLLASFCMTDGGKPLQQRPSYWIISRPPVRQLGSPLLNSWCPIRPLMAPPHQSRSTRKDRRQTSHSFDRQFSKPPTVFQEESRTSTVAAAPSAVQRKRSPSVRSPSREMRDRSFCCVTLYFDLNKFKYYVQIGQP